MTIQVTKVLKVDDDTIEVYGFDDNDPDVELTATGWLSAMTNHFDDAAYDQSGNRTKNAKPREMNEAEKLAYCKSLLQLTIADQPAEAAVVDLGIHG